MQRRNVDLPEPDGPSMHITSPRLTSRSIPFSTSRRPKRLCTPSALTIGSVTARPRAPNAEARDSSLRRCSEREKPRPKRRSMKYCPTYRTLVIARYQMLATISSGIVLKFARVDLLRREQQLEHRPEHEHQRGVLEHRDRLVAGRRDDHPHRLRQHDPPHDLKAAHPQRLRRLGLALVDRDDPGAHDLGHVGALVEPEAEQRGHERRDQRVRVRVDERRPERDPEVDRRVQRRDEVPEQQLDQQRRAAEEPDVEPAGTGDQRVRREPHHRQQHPEDDPDQHREHRQLDRDQDAVQDPRVEQVLPDDVPLEARVGDDRADDRGRHEQHDRPTAIQRPGWRTGTALMSSGRPVRSSEESSEVLTSEP